MPQNPHFALQMYNFINKQSKKKQQKKRCFVTKISLFVPS